MRVVVCSALLALALLAGVVGLLSFSEGPEATRPGSEGPSRREAPSGETDSLVLNDPGGAPAAAEPKSPDSAEPATPSPDPDERLEPLPRGTSDLRLRVLNSSGRPYPDVSVRLLGRSGAQESVTDGDGLADFESIPADLYDLRVQAPDGPLLRASEKHHLQPGETSEVTLRIGRFDLGVSGRVLTRSGRSLAGIAVEATRYPRNQGRIHLVPAERASQRSVSDRRGFYEVRGLEAGDYVLVTEATGEFPPTRRVVQAGEKLFNILLDEGRDLRVTGRVTDLSGYPLESVRVSLLDDSTTSCATGPEGAYELSLGIGETQRTRVLAYQLQGYRVAQVEILRDDLKGSAALERNVSLLPEGFSAPVRGWIRKSDGTVVEGLAVSLESGSLRARLRTESDSTGRFAFPEVEIAEDYSLRVQAPTGWKDHEQRPLRVWDKGVELDIILEQLPSGSITGQVVDLTGRPVPALEFSVRHPRALARELSVKTDESGWFELSEVPAGALEFETRSPPKFTVRDVKLLPGTLNPMRLIVDSGPHELSGTVVDPDGLPLSGARVTLTWIHRSEESSARSSRETTTDAEGHFTFTGLGADAHRLRITARGYHPAQCVCQVGLQPRLEPIALRAQRSAQVSDG